MRYSGQRRQTHRRSTNFFVYFAASDHLPLDSYIQLWSFRPHHTRIVPRLRDRLSRGFTLVDVSTRGRILWRTLAIEIARETPYSRLWTSSLTLVLSCENTSVRSGLSRSIRRDESATLPKKKRCRPRGIRERNQAVQRKPTLRQAWPRTRSRKGRNVRSTCRCSHNLRITRRRAVSCGLHRPTSQVIHRSGFSTFSYTYEHVHYRFGKYTKILH